MLSGISRGGLPPQRPPFVIDGVAPRCQRNAATNSETHRVPELLQLRTPLSLDARAITMWRSVTADNQQLISLFSRVDDSALSAGSGGKAIFAQPPLHKKQPYRSGGVTRRNRQEAIPVRNRQNMNVARCPLPQTRTR